MAQAKRDENRVPVLLGVSSVDGVTPVPIRVDPLTGRVLANILAIDEFASTNPEIKRDENRIQVGTAVTDDSNQTVKPLLSDPNNVGRLLADVVIE